MENEEQTQEPKKETEEGECEILREDFPKFDLSFKIIVIGDAGVGKSCLSLQATKRRFESNYLATIGVESFTFVMRYKDKIIRMQILDTCGQEIYKSLISNFYRNSSLAVLVYSIDSKESFNHVENWLNDLRSQANEDVRVILIGNKADLESERKVSKEEGEKYKLDNNLDFFMETSAKTGQNARNVLVEASKILYNDYLKLEKNMNKVEEPKKKIGGTANLVQPKKKEKGCC